MISPESKVQSPDRVLRLNIMEGKKPVNSTGMIDPTLFKEDGNKLHCVMDPSTCLWSFKYEAGSIPPGLRGNFTGFGSAKKFADQYFFHRNIQVTEVKAPRDAVASS